MFRKLSFSKPYLYETIRPNVVLEAASYLSTTELFNLEKVVVSEDWVNSVTRTGTDNVNCIVNPNDEPCDIVLDQERQDSETVPGIEELFDNLEELLKEIDYSDETKNDLPINPGSLDTLLLSNENLLMKLAPGEGRKPLYFSQDKFIEELAYPCVFAGHCRDLPEDLSILKKSKSDILRLVLLNIYVYSKYRFSVLDHGYSSCKCILYIRALGLGRFATDHSLTKVALRLLFVRIGLLKE